jgi:hypothetical protein
MLNKNVCPNCGQLYDTNLSKCPLCGTAPQVVDTADPVQRKRITETERKQRRAERREAEQEARRRRKDARFMQDAEEERLYEEAEARRKEEKRRLKEEKKAARRGEQVPETSVAPAPIAPAFTPAPARDGRGPMPEEVPVRDRRRVPRFFLVLSTVALAAALLVGGSYLLWKLDVAEIPLYDKLAAQKNETQPPAENGGAESGAQEQETPSATLYRGEGAIPCTGITLSETSIVFTAAGDQTQLSAVLSPADTTDERRFVTSDAAVVKVSPVGIVTAIGPGTAVITVVCGEETAVCAVTCDFEEDSNAGASLDIEELTLIKDDMTFFAAGENYVLSVTNVPAGTPVEWRSLDESVATVDAGGHVVAVGKGTTRVFATVGDLEAYCWVRCKFDQ